MRKARDFAPAYMIDQSHNVTDPIESLMSSAMEIVRAYVQASLINRTARPWPMRRTQTTSWRRTAC